MTAKDKLQEKLLSNPKDVTFCGTGTIAEGLGIY